VDSDLVESLGISDDELPFPTEDVEASRRDKQLQQRHRLEALDEATRQAMEQARQDALLSGSGPGTQWVYFRSPPLTWELLCGREGWLLFDPDSGVQHKFILTTMN
jgi:hypothetical protein